MKKIKTLKCILSLSILSSVFACSNNLPVNQDFTKNEGIKNEGTSKTFHVKFADPSALNQAKYYKNILGYTAKQIRDMNPVIFTAEVLRAAGFNAGGLRKAGFTLTDLKPLAFTDAELLTGGFSQNQISISKLKFAGDSIATIISKGYNPFVLSAGFTEYDVKVIGYTINELRQSGYALDTLKGSGYSDTDLLATGFNQNQITMASLKFAGDSIATIISKGYNPFVLSSGFSEYDIKVIGYTLKDYVLYKGLTVVALANAKLYGYSSSGSKELGYKAIDIIGAGFPVSDIKAIGYTANDCLKSNITTITKSFGYTLTELRDGGYTIDYLITKAISLNNVLLYTSGYSFQEIGAVYTLQEIVNKYLYDSSHGGIRFQVQDIKNLGYTREQIIAAGMPSYLVN
ncbi:MAG: hypothetical protein U0457_00065 [Candidatus Sericytochromatia bacterium]